MRGLCNFTSEVALVRDMDKGTTYLSQTHYARNFTYLQILNATPWLTPMHPNSRFDKDDCDKNLAPNLHLRYGGIVRRLGYLITMTYPDLSGSSSELNHYV